MKTLKLLAFFRLYFTSIDKALLKHRYSTDIALFTQQLRKHIYKGKTCYQRTCLMLYVYLIIGSKLTAEKLAQKLTKPKLSSTGLRVLFGISSRLRPTNVGTASGELRLLFDFPSSRSRSTLEAEPKASRSAAKEVSNDFRRDPETESKDSRRTKGVAIPILLRIYFTYICQALAGHANRLICKGAGRLPKNHRIPSSNFLLTNTCLSSTFYAAGSQFSSGLHRRGPMKNRSQFEENPRKGRSWSGVGRELISLFLAANGTIDSRLSYRECTEKVPKRYWVCTKELLQRYREATNKIQAFSSFLVDLGYQCCSAIENRAKVLDTDLLVGNDPYYLKSNGFKAIGEDRRASVDSFVANNILKAQRALKYITTLGAGKKTFRMSLTCLALISMFSLSAQTPRRDSGAEGLTLPILDNQPSKQLLENSQPLMIGEKVPNEFWEKEHLFYINGDTIRKNLKEYRGKLLILDFWASWCGPCLHGFYRLENIQKTFPSDCNVLMVNDITTRDKFSRVHEIYQKTTKENIWKGQVPTIIMDDYLTRLFKHIAVPYYVWISEKGVPKAYTRSSFVGINEVFNYLNPSL
ncbi:MAG: TlpA family protein disulfide reductase [Sphingobacterium sp.]|jgi:thiol-disulfide isomerase/thioredoxin|nr:TlpA family protein disulfide reductase [Sphingobacterium sp.]